ncbi:glycerol kinase GlpK [Thermoflavifilum thermophilum]|uniref:Glycerol kinase n=1 Tax=Thermoflavifilum thermophilum TaxID=1393122 RepID=A0A1I7MZG4_9BACT|nr:glycerol kinase GlpK [Thermoflavifilum thermophilum]SFV27794.1 glycerol kinase [Thermoflavifilum thermophilum]
MKAFILALDQGTTSSRAILFDQSGQIRAVAQKEFTQHYPQPGWVEHDPMEIWSTQAGVAAEVLSRAGISSQQIAAIGITNQRETTIVWERNTGKPIYPAIVWQDRRTADWCDQLRVEAGELIRQKTGLLPDAYFSATKIRWILDHVPDARKKAENGELAFGTIDSWLIWNFTRGRVHATDVTNASRTMLFNIHTGQWDPELLALLDIPQSLLPEVVASSGVVAETSGDVLTYPIPIAGIAGDQQAALFGQMCTEPGMVKNTYGTGCFVVMQTGSKPVQSQNRLLTTIAWEINGQLNYALEGSIFIGGAVVQWLRDGLQMIRSSSEIETLARQVPDTGGVYVVPAFTGLGAPHWNQQARGMIVGLTRGSTHAHIARAALESIAYQTYDVVRAMEADTGLSISEMRVDGGAAVNDLLMQFQANILNTQVVRPAIVETTAQGAAYLAGLAVGFWKDIETIRAQWKESKRFIPQMSEPVRTTNLQGWARALKAVRCWAE